MAKTVVVLGASYGGLGVVHKLLKTAPNSIPDLKVILVSPTTHLYWNIAAPRAIIPNAIPDEELIRPLAPGLAQYPPEIFQFIVGTATSIDQSTKAVTVTTTQGESQTLNYDVLVVATGARYADPDMPWKNWGTYEEVLGRLHTIRNRVATASHIVVAGGGTTGVETAAELGYNYAAGKSADAAERKQVTLLSAGPRLLNGDSLAAGIEKELTNLGVSVKNNSKVQETRPTPEGKTEVMLEGGETVVCDVYLTTMGLRPNSEVLPGEMLTEKGYLSVNEFFQVKGFDNVFGVGDIISIPRAGWAITDWQSPQVARNVELFLKGQPPKNVSQLPVDALLTSLGPKRGAGRVNFVKMPSFVVSKIKSKSLVLERAGKTINGGNSKA